jgi:hypothetical protein
LGLDIAYFLRREIVEGVGKVQEVKNFNTSKNYYRDKSDH